jgi:hypothetical protein
VDGFNGEIMLANVQQQLVNSHVVMAYECGRKFLQQLKINDVRAILVFVDEQPFFLNIFSFTK